MTSDGREARLEMQCGPEREVRLLHEALDAVPAETDKNPRYDGTVAVISGWGLDLCYGRCEVVVDRPV